MDSDDDCVVELVVPATKKMDFVDRSGVVSRPKCGRVTSARTMVEKKFAPAGMESKKRPVGVLRDLSPSLGGNVPFREVDVVRKSLKCVDSKGVLSMNSTNSSDDRKNERTCHVYPEEISHAAEVSFGSALSNIEVMVELDTIASVCPDFRWVGQNQRAQLGGCYNRNYQFHTRLDQQALAVRLLRLKVGRRFFPEAHHVHDILHKIILTAEERLMLHCSLDLVYRVLSFHPPDSTSSRQYYWRLLSDRFDDKDPSSRWEHLRDLLESLSECEGVDKDAWGTCPSTAEGKHSLASFWVHVLQDDLKCWLRACPNASQSLADKQDMPLMARLLWPHVQLVGHINASCRELIRIHLKALEGNMELLLELTVPLTKMLASVVHLCDIQQPVKIRKPAERMSSLADESVVLFDQMRGSLSAHVMLQGLASTQLRLLVSMALLGRSGGWGGAAATGRSGKRHKTGSALSSQPISLSSIASAYLGISAGQVPAAERNNSAPDCLALEAAASYMCLFRTARIIFYLRDKKRNPAANNAGGTTGAAATKKAELFSASFSFADLMEDLKVAKALLQRDADGRTGFYNLCML